MSKVEALVLDTHVWLDIALGRGRIAAKVMRKIDAAAAAGVLYVAAITPWEVAMLARSGKLRVSGPTCEWLSKALRDTCTAIAPLDLAVAVDAVELPAWAHGDPADRIIVATARFMNALLITRDGAILDYGAKAHTVRILEPN
jgi:PIN domain nuclease of toxin-antitoxin system